MRGTRDHFKGKSSMAPTLGTRSLFKRVLRDLCCH